MHTLFCPLHDNLAFRKQWEYHSTVKTFDLFVVDVANLKEFDLVFSDVIPLTLILAS